MVSLSNHERTLDKALDKLIQNRPYVLYTSFVSYCTVCHNYVFMSHREEIVKAAANRHVEETHHRVIVGYEIHKEER